MWSYADSNPILFNRGVAEDARRHRTSLRRDRAETKARARLVARAFSERRLRGLRVDGQSADGGHAPAVSTVIYVRPGVCAPGLELSQRAV